MSVDFVNALSQDSLAFFLNNYVSTLFQFRKA